MRHLRKLLPDDRRGAAAVECALVMTVLLVMLGGIADYGMELWVKTSLANAVAEGEWHAYQQETANGTVSSTALKTFVQTVFPLSGATATITGPSCYCIAGTPPSLGTAVACTTTCSDGTKAGSYVVISASYSYTPFLPNYSKIGTNTTITQSATVRIQ